MISVIRENRTLREMLVGIGISGVVAVILSLIFSDNFLYDFVGLIAGTAGAVFMAIHMGWTIEDAVLLDEKGAIAYTRKMTYVRYIIICVIVILVGVTKIGSPVMCVIGVLLLKAGAYMQPLVHRITFKDNEQTPDSNSENNITNDDNN